MTRHFVWCSIACCLLATGGCGKTSRPDTSSEQTPALTPAAGPGMGAPGQRRCAQHFASFDDDANGRVSRAEFLAHPHPRGDAVEIFDLRDADDDGALTEAELCAGWRGRGAPAAGKPYRGSGPMTRVMRCERHFHAFDENGDGAVSLEEFSAWPHVYGDPKLLFETRDGNRDGTISRAEFCAGWSAPGPRPPR